MPHPNGPRSTPHGQQPQTTTPVQQNAARSRIEVPNVRNEPLRSYDIERARDALARVNALGNGVNDDVRAVAKKLPMMIRTCGLAQAIAFYEAKRGTHRTISDDCGQWLCHLGILPAANGVGLCAQLVGNGSTPQLLRRCTSEVMAYLYWYIRFLDARRG